MIWSLSALAFGYAFFQRVAPSVMVNDLMAEFAVSGAVLGQLSALYFYPYAAMQLPIGALLDRHPWVLALINLGRFAEVRRALPELRMVMVAGPRIDPEAIPAHEGLEETAGHLPAALAAGAFRVLTGKETPQAYPYHSKD